MRIARSEGAVDTAARYGEVLLGRLGSLDDAIRRQAAVELVANRVARGDDRGARELAERHVGDLGWTDRGVGWLGALGIERPERMWLPSGKPNLTGLGRAVGEGTVEPERLVRILGSRPRRWLAEPQAHLLVYHGFVGKDPARASAYLSRFLRAHGLPGCDLQADGPWPLDGYRLRSTSRVRRGPLVSVLVSAYDAERTVVPAVQSLLQQAYAPFEVLLCDDASRDRTLELSRRWFGDDPRVRLFRSAANQGPYNVRNALLEKARGELVTFHDADDLALPERLGLQVRELARPGAVASIGRLVRVRPDGRVVLFVDQNLVRRSAVTLMASRETFRRAGPFRSARYGADHEMIGELEVRHGSRSLVSTPRPLMLGLWSAGSLTRAAGSEALETGYRSPERRRYAELVFRRRHGIAPVEPDEIDDALRSAGNLLEPRPVTELG